jgi:hypothetical protein
MFNSKIGIGVLKHPGYNGKGGSTSSSTAKDFFGEGKRAPYEELLSTLLLGGTIGGTEGYYTRGGGGGYNDPEGGHWESKPNGFGLTNSVWVPNSRGNKGKGGQGTYVPGTPGMSIGDYIKQTPGYQFGMNTGLEALNRNFAATGVGQGGAQSVALQNYGNQYAGQAYQQLISNLMGPSGAAMSVGNNSQSQTTPAGIGGDIAGAITSFGLSKIFPSDKNLKTNIKHINTINGIKIYSFNYIWSYLKSVGVMAQDLLEMPEYKHTVHTTNIGYVVDYSKLPI